MSNKIKEIDLQNFQGWVRGRIPLGGFNVIVGQSSSGKTSIFRALRWLLYGEWDDTYPNDKSRPTACAITLDNGTRILRLRDGNTNQAAIITPTETVKYKSFGAVIPGIRSHLNLEPIEIGNSSVNLNFSLQDDPIFMVNESRPNKAQWIGRLYGAHVLNEMLRDMAKDKKSIDAKKKDKEIEIDKLNLEIAGYTNLEEQEQTVKEIEGMIERYDNLSKCHSELLVLDTYRDQLNKDLWASNIDINNIKTDILKLSKLIDLNNTVSEIASLRNQVEKYGIIDTDYLLELKNDINELSELRLASLEMDDISRDKIAIKSEVTKIKKAITGHRKKIEAHIIKDGICPVCGGDASACTDRVVDNIKRIATHGI